MYMWNPYKNKYQVEKKSEEVFRLLYNGNVMVENTPTKVQEAITAELRMQNASVRFWGIMMLLTGFVAMVTVPFSMTGGVLFSIVTVFAAMKFILANNRFQMLAYLRY